MIQYTVTEYDMEDYEMFRATLTDEAAADLLDQISDGWIGSYSFTGAEGDFERFTLHMALARGAEALRGRSES